MKTYRGVRGFNDRAEIIVDDPTINLTVHLQHFVRHSPDGLEWGYAGSGPSDLARSILIDHFGGVGNLEATAKAEPLYQKFKFEFLVDVGNDGFEITATEIDEWIRRAQMLISGKEKSEWKT